MRDTDSATDSTTDSPSVADTHADLSQLFKNPDSTSQEVVRSVFGLKHVETRAYLALLEHPQSSANDLAEELDRHRRHVARSLRGIHEAGLAERHKHIFDTGGKGYIYDPVPATEAKQYLQQQLTDWVAHLRTEIETFDTEIEAALASESGSDDGSSERDT